MIVSKLPGYPMIISDKGWGIIGWLDFFDSDDVDEDPSVEEVVDPWT